MCLLLETIKVLNGTFLHLPFHQERINHSQGIHFPGCSLIRLSEIPIPPGIKDQVYKCRIIYGAELQITEFSEYVPKPINHLKLVVADHLDYSFKYADRSGIHILLSGLRDDEDIIIIKKGMITDTSYTNLAFYTGSGWFTPASPLLEGTCRKRLLHEQKIRVQEIVPADLVMFQKVSLINAMLDLDEKRLPIHQIW